MDKKEIINAGVSISASLGEYEPLSIGIYSDRYSGSLRLETSELINQNGQNLEVENQHFCCHSRTKGPIYVINT